MSTAVKTVTNDGILERMSNFELSEYSETAQKVNAMIAPVSDGYEVPKDLAHLIAEDPERAVLQLHTAADILEMYARQIRKYAGRV